MSQLAYFPYLIVKEGFGVFYDTHLMRGKGEENNKSQTSVTHRPHFRRCGNSFAGTSQVLGQLG